MINEYFFAKTGFSAAESEVLIIVWAIMAINFPILNLGISEILVSAMNPLKGVQTLDFYWNS